MKDHRLYKSIQLRFWAVIGIKRRDDNEAKTLVDSFSTALMKYCKQQGVAISNGPDKFLCENSLDAILKKIREVQEKLTARNSCPQIIFILSFNTIPTEWYNQIKRLGDTELGIQTQCVVNSRNIQKESPSFYTNLILKLNSKLGGINLALADNHFMESVPTIIFGADVTHPSPGSRKECRSVSAVVWSMDKTGFQYDGEWDYQEGKKEMISHLDNMVLNGLKVHCEKTTNTPPKRLIFFRDGVSDGQLEQVIDIELPLIRKACANANLKNIKITLIVTQKRHNHRFDASVAKDSDPNSGNLKSGVVIETGVTHPTDYDFFILSHAGILGTSRPCYYRVLIDENKIDTDELQGFIYNYCYLFARCTRSVSLVPAVYYADCLCDRGRRCLDDNNEKDFPEKKISGMSWI